MSKHSHYFKPVRHLTEIDVYRVCDLFQVNDPSGATQHAIKKLLLPGQRGGGKDMRKDMQEAVDTLVRRLAMLDEDQTLIDDAIHAGLNPAYRGVILAGHEVDTDFDSEKERLPQIATNGNEGEHYPGAVWRINNGDKPDLPNNTVVIVELVSGEIIKGQIEAFQWVKRGEVFDITRWRMPDESPYIGGKGTVVQ